jgi:hypothetical protein
MKGGREMKDQFNTGETVYKDASGRILTESEYQRIATGAADKRAGIRGKDEVTTHDIGTNASSGKN